MGRDPTRSRREPAWKSIFKTTILVISDMRNFLISAVFLALALAGTPSVGAPATPPATKAPATSARLTTEIALVDSSGTTLGHQKLNTTLGAKELVTAKAGGRSVTCEAAFGEGDRLGCVKVDLTVTDRTIDASGRFSRTEWRSTIQTCDAQPLTVGHADQVRVRISVERH
jgi:hypothetical protein